MLSSTIGYLLPMIVNFLSVPFLLDKLGESAYGLQSLVGVIIGYLAFMDMGIDLPLTKYLAEDRAKSDKDKASNLIKTTTTVYFVLGIVGFISIFSLSEWFVTYLFKIDSSLQSEAVIVFRLAAIGFLGSIGQTWGRALSNGLQRLDIGYSISTSLNILGTIIGLFAVYFNKGIIGYVFFRVIFTSISGPIYFFVLRYLYPDLQPGFGFDLKTFHRIKEYLGFGTLNRIVSSLASRIDQTFLGIFVGVSSVGIYAVPFMITSQLGYLFAYMLAFIFPMSSDLLARGDLQGLQNIYQKSIRFLVTLGGLVFIVLFAYGDIFLTLWAPKIASQANPVFKLLIFSGYILLITTTITNSIMVGIGKIRQFSIYALTRAIVFSVASYILIRQYEIVGAGYAVLVSDIVDIVYFTLFLKKYININPIIFIKKILLRPILFGMFFYIILIIVKPFVIGWFYFSLSIITFSILYFASAYFFNIFGNTEKILIDKMFSSIFKKVTV